MIIFYFSGTGNTKYVAEYFSFLMKEKDDSSEIYDIVGLEEEKARALVKNHDTIFLAYPIYGSDLPDNMKRFISCMPIIQSDNPKDLGVICTQMAFSGDGASVMKNELRRKGYKQKWAYQINMPNNLCMKGSPLKMADDYSRHEQKYLINARETIAHIVTCVIKQEAELKDNKWYHTLLGLTQRPWYRGFLKKKYAKKLDVIDEKCNSCGLCVRICPNGVIKKTETIEFEKQDQCTVCLRCINFCPTGAIIMGGGVVEPRYKGPTKEVYLQMIRDK